jgi:hypothetical protein
LLSLEVAQQTLFAQQAGLHAFSLAAFERMHDRAESGVAATGSVTASKSENANLLNTTHLLA